MGQSAVNWGNGEGTVLQLHGILYRYMPQPGGHWKVTNNDIIERLSDGNGRMARPLTLQLLFQFDYAVGRFIIIERGRGAKGDRVRAEILKRNLPLSMSEIEEACPGDCPGEIPAPRIDLTSILTNIM